MSKLLSDLGEDRIEVLYIDMEYEKNINITKILLDKISLIGIDIVKCIMFFDNCDKWMFNLEHLVHDLNMLNQKCSFYYIFAGRGNTYFLNSNLFQNDIGFYKYCLDETPRSELNSIIHNFIESFARKANLDDISNYILKLNNNNSFISLEVIDQKFRYLIFFLLLILD